MKKIGSVIRYCLDRLEGRWRTYSYRKQRKLVSYLFVGYLVVFLFAMLGVYWDVRKHNAMMSIDHISVLKVGGKMDSLHMSGALKDSIMR